MRIMEEIRRCKDLIQLVESRCGAVIVGSSCLLGRIRNSVGEAD